MSDLDNFIWDCSDEKIARIVKALGDAGMPSSLAVDTVKAWREVGWSSISDKEKRVVLKVLGTQL